MNNAEDTTQHDNKVAVSASRPLNCSTARGTEKTKEKFIVQVEVKTIRQYELESIDDLPGAIKDDGFSTFEYEIL